MKIAVLMAVVFFGIVIGGCVSSPAVVNIKANTSSSSAKSMLLRAHTDSELAATLSHSYTELKYRKKHRSMLRKLLLMHKQNLSNSLKLGKKLAVL